MLYWEYQEFKNIYLLVLSVHFIFDLFFSVLFFFVFCSVWIRILKTFSPWFFGLFNSVVCFCLALLSSLCFIILVRFLALCFFFCFSILFVHSQVHHPDETFLALFFFVQFSCFSCFGVCFCFIIQGPVSENKPGLFKLVLDLLSVDLVQTN